MKLTREKSLARAQARELGHMLTPFRQKLDGLWIARCKRHECSRVAMVGGIPLVTGDALERPCAGRL